MPNTALEIAMIKKFVVKHKQERYAGFLSSQKNRKKFLDTLAHFRDFQWDKFDELSDTTVKQSAMLISRLKSAGLTDANCYLISEDAETDTKTMSLTAVVKESILMNVKGCATILIFGDANVVVFLDEPPNGVFISKI